MRRPRFTLRGFERPHASLQRALGELERAVLDQTWRLGSATVRDVFDALNVSRSPEKHVAYTTAMTTLDRLYKKRLLSRKKSGRAFLYAPRISREEFDRVVATDVIDALLGAGKAGPAPVLACIVDAISARDRGLLDELDRLVAAKRHLRPQDRATSKQVQNHAIEQIAAEGERTRPDREPKTRTTRAERRRDGGK